MCRTRAWISVAANMNGTKSGMLINLAGTDVRHDLHPAEHLLGVIHVCVTMPEVIMLRVRQKVEL